MDKTNDIVYYIGCGSNDNIDIIIFVGGDENKNTEYAQNPYNNGLYCYKSIVFMGFIHPFYIKNLPDNHDPLDIHDFFQDGIFSEKKDE